MVSAAVGSAVAERQLTSRAAIDRRARPNLQACVPHMDVWCKPA
jgi:hypothetical protein